MRNEIRGRYRGGIGLPSARPGEESQDLLSRDARSAKRTQAAIAVAFGEAPAIRADNERNVDEIGRGKFERMVKQQLPWSRADKVIAAHDAGDAVVGIINDDGELIR